MADRRAPGPSGLPFLGSVLALRGNAYQTMLDWQSHYGDVTRYRLGPQVLYMVGHPALAEEVLITHPERYIKMYEPERPSGLSLLLGQGLVTSRGELWQRQRRLMQPFFHRSRVAGFASAISAAGADLAERWHRAPPGTLVAVDRDMARTTLDLITRTMFSTSVLNKVDQLFPALDLLLGYTSNHLLNPLRPPLWCPTAGNRAFKRALALVDELVVGMIRTRREGGQRFEDLLDRLVNAGDENGIPPMSDRQIRDEVLTIFIAGHETTAVALTWTWYLLATHPQTREKLHEELAEVLGGRAPTVADLPRLLWTRAVLEESLRLFPPAPGVIRKAATGTELGGYRVPAGALVFVNIGNIHRNGAFWTEPDHFRPERHLAAEPAPGHRLAFMPFGAGPRFCLGNHLANLEALLLLAQLAQEFRLDLPPETRVEPEIRLTLRPRGGLRLEIQRRT